jgi:hypothetical protein
MPAMARVMRLAAAEIMVEQPEEFEAGAFISFKTNND